MLLLLSVTLDCQLFKLGKEQWHNEKLKINSLVSIFLPLPLFCVSIHREKNSMYCWKRDVLAPDSEWYTEITVRIKTPREEKYIGTSN